MACEFQQLHHQCVRTKKLKRTTYIFTFIHSCYFFTACALKKLIICFIILNSMLYVNPLWILCRITWKLNKIWTTEGRYISLTLQKYRKYRRSTYGKMCTGNKSRNLNVYLLPLRCSPSITAEMRNLLPTDQFWTCDACLVGLPTLCSFIVKKRIFL